MTAMGPLPAGGRVVVERGSGNRTEFPHAFLMRSSLFRGLKDINYLRVRPDDMDDQLSIVVAHDRRPGVALSPVLVLPDQLWDAVLSRADMTRAEAC